MTRMAYDGDDTHIPISVCLEQGSQKLVLVRCRRLRDVWLAILITYIVSDFPSYAFPVLRVKAVYFREQLEKERHVDSSFKIFR